MLRSRCVSLAQQHLRYRSQQDRPEAAEPNDHQNFAHGCLHYRAQKMNAIANRASVMQADSAMRFGPEQFMAQAYERARSWARALRRNSFSYTNLYGYLSKSKGFAMHFFDPTALTALAALVSSVASLVWALRRNPGNKNGQ